LVNLTNIGEIGPKDDKSSLQKLLIIFLLYLINYIYRNVLILL